MAASGFKMFTAVHKEWPIQLYRDQCMRTDAMFSHQSPVKITIGSHLKQEQFQRQ